MAAITSAQTGNWSDTATWTGGVVPVEGDTATIAVGHTVTQDQNIIIGSDSGNVLTVNGVFNVPYNIASDYSLTLKGSIVFGNGGEFRIGDSSNRLDNTKTYTININYSTTLAARKYAFYVGATGKLLWYGAGKTTDTTLTSDAIANNSNKVISVTDATGWRVGDIIALVDKENRLLTEENIIESISGNDITLTNIIGITITAVEAYIPQNKFVTANHGLNTGDIIQFTNLDTVTGLNLETDYSIVRIDTNSFSISGYPLGGTNSTSVVYTRGKKKSGWFVMNCSSNIIVKPYDINYLSNFTIAGTGTNQNIISYVMFNNLGDATARGVNFGNFTLNSTNNNNNVFFLYKCYNLSANACSGNTIDCINSYADRQIGIAFSFTLNARIIKANIVKSTSVAVDRANQASFIKIDELNIYSCGSNAITGTQSTDSNWDIGTLNISGVNGAGILGTINNLKINTATIRYCSTYGIAETLKNIYIKNLTCSNNTTADINAGGQTIETSNLTSSTPIAYAGTGLPLRITNYNAGVGGILTGYNRTFFNGCIMQSDKDIYRTVVPSLNCYINSTNRVPFTLSGNARTAYVNYGASGKTITLNCHTRKDITSTDAIAKLRISCGSDGHGLDECTEYDILPSATETWESKSINLGTTTSAGFITIELVVTKGASTWNLWIDDLEIVESDPV